MTDRREPPALGPAAPDRDESPARRPATWVMVVGSLAIPLAIWLGKLAIEHEQRAPARRLPFDRITLDPGPPACYRPGAEGLLAGVRKLYGADEVPALAVDLEKLKEAFQLHPWVRAVHRIGRRYPNRLVVTLDYRKPVARLILSGAAIALDDEAHALPDDEVAPGEVLIPVRGLRPSSALAGRPLKVEAELGRLTPPELPSQVARLAAFLKEKLTGPSPIPFRIEDIELTYQPSRETFYLWVQIPPNLSVCWRSIPPDRPDPPGDADNWAALIDWMAHPDPPSARDPGTEWLLRLDRGKTQADRRLDR